jgi:type IV secretion system protein VirD4
VWDTDGGVYFGYATNATEESARPKIGREIRYVGDRHLMTIGPNGSGKSRRVVLPNLAQLKGWSIVVVDPKGDLCQMTRDYRENHGAKSVIMNPFGVLDLASDGYNPVAALDAKSPDFPDDAFGLAESMIRVQGNEPHWSASAQDLVAGLIMAVRLTLPPGVEDQEPGSLAHVREMLGYDYVRFRTNILNLIEVAKIEKCPELEAKLSRFSVMSNESRELNSILSTAQTQTRWLDSRPIKTDLGKGAFDFSLLKEQPTTVYLTLPARRLGTHATWLRLMIASIIQPLLKDTRKPKVPVLLVLDEYPALAAGGFAVIEKNMAMFRGFGIKLWTVWQDLGQAINLYGKGWESFVANAGVLQSFAPQDVVTAEHLSKLMPLTVMTSEQRSLSFDGGEGDKDKKEPVAKHSVNSSDQPMPVMLPQHLRNMDDGYSVLFSHKLKGPARTFFPFKVAGLDEVYFRDPS